MSEKHQIVTHVQSNLGDIAALTINIQAYPKPYPSDYIWYKCFENNCTRLTNGGHYIIHIGDLKSVLFIMNVTKFDVTQYKVKVSNGIGKTLELDFFVTEEGKVCLIEDICCIWVLTVPSTCLCQTFYNTGMVHA